MHRDHQDTPSRFRAVALDLDGTLLTSSRRISSFTAHVLRKLVDLGVHIIIASGRGEQLILHCAEYLPQRFHIVAHNGGISALVERRDHSWRDTASIHPTGASVAASESSKQNVTLQTFPEKAHTEHFAHYEPKIQRHDELHLIPIHNHAIPQPALLRIFNSMLSHTIAIPMADGRTRGAADRMAEEGKLESMGDDAEGLKCESAKLSILGWIYGDSHMYVQSEEEETYFKTIGLDAVLERNLLPLLKLDSIIKIDFPINFPGSSPQSQEAYRIALFSHLQSLGLESYGVHIHNLSRNLDVSVTNKGEGLRELCAHIGVDMSEVVAFGDDGNDVGMLRSVGMGIAPSNAREAAKIAARKVSLFSNDEDCVGRELSEIFALN